jgi:hypothetical protein
MHYSAGSEFIEYAKQIFDDDLMIDLISKNVMTSFKDLNYLFALTLVLEIYPD